MRQWRAGGLLVGCGAFLIATTAWAPRLPAPGWTAWCSWLKADPQCALAVLAGGVGWLLAAWLFLVTVLALLASTAHLAGRAAELLTPRFARGLLTVLLGTALAAGSAAPALAGGPPSAVASTSQPALAPVPAPVLAPPELPALLDLDRPGVSPPRPVAIPRPAREPAAQRTYEVKAGDTLWALAADRLPAGTSAERITRGWQEWYLANRQEIGTDPGFLLVGESLQVPS